MKLSIIHLTDLHVKNRIMFLEHKIESIVNIIRNDDFSENVLLLFSGDITFSGESDQYKVANEFINCLKNKLEKEDKKVYLSICPGNHDRCFAENEKIEMELIKSFDSDNFVKYICEYNHLLVNYNEFESGVSRNVNFKKINDILSSYTYTIDESKITIYSLNNTLLSAYIKGGIKEVDYNYRNIFIPRDLLEINRGNEEYVFLLMHMPLHYLSPKTKAALHDICQRNIDIVFDGHEHEESLMIGSDKYCEIMSSALYSNDMSGFSLIHLNDNSLESKIYVFNEGDKKYRLDNGHSAPPITFDYKKSTSDGFIVNKKTIDKYSLINIQDNFKLSLDDVYIFPLLTEKRYKTSSKRHIESLNQFFDFINPKKIINIIGEESIGKSSLARHLFYRLIDNGFSPILCDGNELGTEKTKKSAKERILFQIGDSYLNKNISEDYFEVELGNRILIVDNYTYVSPKTLVGLLELFDKIIFFSDDEVDDIFSINGFQGIPSSVLEIEPFYRSKREEMCSKIYDAFISKQPSIKENINKSNYISSLENAIAKMSLNHLVIPPLLIDLSAKILLNLNIYTSGNNIAYLRGFYKNKIDKALVLTNNKKCTNISLERMVSSIAYRVYMDKLLSFGKTFFEDALNKESDDYGNTPFDSVETFIDFLANIKFVKQSTISDGEYSFYDKKVFAFYVGKFCFNCHVKGDEKPINNIISRGIYSQLNFNILMSIAYSYELESIPQYFVEDLYNEVSEYKDFKLKSLDGIKVYFLKEKERISNIDDKEKKKIRREISRDEEKARIEHVENSDNFYYEKKTSEHVHELIEMTNKMQIVSILLNSSDLLKKEQKDKLVKLTILMPNIILDRYVSYVQNDLDVLFIKILDDLEQRGKNNSMNVENAIDEFFDYLISIVTATILTIYDVSSRALKNPIMNERLNKELKENKEDNRLNMYDIQRLMLLSFSKDENYFVREISEYLDNEKDSFNKNCAFLIARRYCIDNYDYLVQTKSKFLTKIRNVYGNSLIALAKKK